MVIVWFFSIVFVYAASTIAMEEQNEQLELISPTTPRLWVQTLTEQKKLIEKKKVKKIPFTQSRYTKLLDDYIKLITKQKPEDQLKHYLTMIKEAFEEEDEDTKLITSLCEYFAQVYNDHFYNTAYEEETSKYVRDLKKLLRSKNNYKDILNFLRFSRTGALAPLPLQEDNPEQSRKESFKGSNGKIHLKNQQHRILGKECRAFGTNYTVKSLVAFENKILTATSEGSLVVYDYVTGCEVFRNENAKNKKPLTIIESLIKSKNKDLKVKQLGSDCHSIVFYRSNDSRLRCILPTNDLLIVSNQSGELIGERFSKKKKMRYEKDGQEATALYAVNKSRFLSGYQNGAVKYWDIEKEECLKIIEVEHDINDFTRFNGNLICLCGLHYLHLLMLGKQRSLCLYSSQEEIKKIFGFHDFLIAGLKNGSVRLWHKDLGYNKTALLHLKDSEHFYKFVAHDQDLFCCYKNGMVIKLPYSFLSKVFECAIAYDFKNNTVPIIEISSQ